MAWPDEAGNRPEDQGDRHHGYDQDAGALAAYDQPARQASQDQAAHDQASHDQAAADHPGRPQWPADPELAGDERLAMLCYLSVPFLGFLVPLAVYVLRGRRSSFVRGHAAQALNLSVTVLLYTFCVLIVGTILALDTISVALLIGVPLVAALWIATLGYLAGPAPRPAAATTCGFRPGSVPLWPANRPGRPLSR